MAIGEKITIETLRQRKRAGEKFAVLTCYDHPTARLIENAGIEVILVGDTIGEVVLGHHSTIPVKLDFLLTITEAVRRGAPNVFLLGDMPYLTYQVNPEEAIRNAGRFMADAGCDAVKVEVDHRLLTTVEAMAAATIPVFAHIGLKPQSIHSLGGYKSTTKTAHQAKALIDQARQFEDAGVVGLLLEAVPAEVAEIITEKVAVPVIGCVAGPQCDGTVVVLHDMLGLGGGHPPRTVKRYAELNRQMADAIQAYADDVHQGRFPAKEHSLKMPEDQLNNLKVVL
jgi:3-methyl-2-oxobutanoate hydroxymethyltransferase